MWNRIANSNNSSTIYRGALIPRIFNHTRPVYSDAYTTSTVNSFGPFQLSLSSSSSISIIQRRQKHSQTQIKRLFKEHPARLRVEKRLWNIDRAQPRVILPTDSIDTSSPPTTNISSLDTNIAFEHQLLAEVPTTPASPLDNSPSSDEPVAQLQLSLLYPPIYTIPTILPNGWFPPMDPQLRPKYPFSIRRTKNKPKDAIGFLPIYTKYRYVRS